MKSFFFNCRRSHRALVIVTTLLTGVVSGATFDTASAAPLVHGIPVSQDGQSTVTSLPRDIPDGVKGTFEKLEKSSVALKSKFDKGDASLTRNLTEKARLSIAAGALTTHLPNGAEFNTESATTYIPKDGGGPTILRLPLVGGNLAKPSVLGVMVDPKTDSVVFTTEMLISALDSNSVQVTVWNDGKLSLNKIASAEGQVRDAGVAPSVNIAAAADGFWGRLNDCLAGLGIGWAAVTAISVACSVACVVTAGTGCALCIIAAAGVTNANIAGCIAQASQG